MKSEPTSIAPRSRWLSSVNSFWLLMARSRQISSGNANVMDVPRTHNIWYTSRPRRAYIQTLLTESYAVPGHQAVRHHHSAGHKVSCRGCRWELNPGRKATPIRQFHLRSISDELYWPDATFVCMMGSIWSLIVGLALPSSGRDVLKPIKNVG